MMTNTHFGDITERQIMFTSSGEGQLVKQEKAADGWAMMRRRDGHEELNVAHTAEQFVP